jgi:peptidoglycan/LPS O-acetylase OafA/YrhL
VAEATDLDRPLVGGEPAPPAEASPRRFRGDIDGLRAIAILLVVAYHAGVPGIAGGFVGVDVFFVISGYLITRNLLTETEGSGRVSLVSFWARRIRRLMPAMALVVVATLVGSLLVLPAVSMSTVATQGASASLYVSNLYFAVEARSYFGAEVQGSPFLHTWSLGVEEQFYVVWPILVAAVVWAATRRRARVRAALVAVFAVVLVVSFALSLRLTAQLDPWAFYGLQSRAWEFAVAGLLAAVAVPRAFTRPWVRTAAAVAGLGLVAVAALVLTSATPYPGAWALLPVVGTVLVILAGSSAGDAPVAVVRGLESRPAQWVGRASYSWYLWHWPAIVLAAAWLGDTTGVKLAAAAASLAVAAACHRYVENPVRFSPRLARSVAPTYVLGVAVTVVALVVGVGVRVVAERTVSGPAKLLATALLDRGVEVCTETPTTPGGIELCVSGDIDADRTILVIGDSHARMWSTALDEVGRAEGIRIVGRWLGSCPPLAVELEPDKAGQDGIDQCRSFRTDTARVIDEVDPDGIVVSQANFYEHRILADDRSDLPKAQRAERWGAHFEELLAELRATGVPVGLIRDSPQFAPEAFTCLETAEHADACAPPRAETVGRTAPIRDAEDAVLAELDDLPQLATTDVICDAERCNLVDPDSTYLRYYDPTHLTAAFTRSQAGPLAALLHEVLARGG